MLIDTTILEPDIRERIRRWGLDIPIAEDPETGCLLVVGYGRRRAGRPRRYYIRAPRELLPGGSFTQEQIGTVTAHYDEDAIVEANKRLPKLLASREMDREFGPENEPTPPERTGAREGLSHSR
jgi:hypothetical protein